MTTAIDFKACPRCRGDVQTDLDEYGPFRKCMQCGHYEDAAREKVRDVPKARHIGFSGRHFVVPYVGDYSEQRGKVLTLRVVRREGVADTMVGECPFCQDSGPIRYDRHNPVLVCPQAHRPAVVRDGAEIVGWR